MAKTVGSEDKEARAGARKGGDPDDTNKVVTPEMYLKAVKEITAAKAKAKAAADAYKALRKDWGASGIKLMVLDSVVRLAEWSRGEIRDHFAVTRQYAEWLGLPVTHQGNLLEGLTDDQVQRREWFAIGRTYSRTGKAGRPPEECPEEYTQDFMAGFNEEDEASWMDSDTPDQQEEAPPAAAAEPEAPEQPSWKGYSDDTADWFAAQWRDFNTWYDSVPAGSTVKISHAGVLEAFRKRRDGLIDEGGNPVTPTDDSAALDGEPLPDDAEVIPPTAKGKARAKAGLRGAKSGLH